MLITIIVWIYIALMIAVSRWPDIGAMVLTFLLLGGIPLVLVIFIVVRGSKLDQIRRQQRARRDEQNKKDSMQG
ncbi:MAG: hypothetical protein AMJ68_05245 [Acidithiobacillales bacterium SG8_45]|jgi:hypothetical protein|nr:MAG: hypothetical protein AMJ68_05245 [Acidithiobacillales bacterium SG8_45]